MKEDNADKLKQLINAMGRIEPGSITHIEVLHDDGCPTLHTGSFKDCTCTPDIKRMGCC